MKTHLEKTCIFYEFWHHFGRLLAPFWQPKCNQKSNEILEAILEVKKEGGLLFWGRFCGMRGVPGEPMEGYENELRQRIPAENQGEGKELSKSGLARRLRWGGGTLRAFRRTALYEKSVK